MSRDGNKGAVRWMVGNSVASNLLMMVFLVGGIIFAYSIKKEVFPEFDLDTVSVKVSYPGAGPEEVENGIVLAIEEQVRGIEGVKNVFSTSHEGVASVSIELLRGVDQNKVYQEIQQQIGKISTFPIDSEKPEVTLLSKKREVMNLILYGDFSESVMFNYAEMARDALLSDKDIDQVQVTGTRQPEISIEIPEHVLRRYNLTLPQIAGKIRSSAIEIPSGAIKTGAGEILLRVQERREYGLEFGNIPIIVSEKGATVLLRDIATIKDDFEESDACDTYNGKRAVNIDVFRMGDQTPIQVADGAKRVLKEIRKDLPPGMKIEIRNDRSEIYMQRMNLMLRNAYIGMALVLILLALFLEVRLAFWVTLGIPVSFLGSFLFLPAMGVSINMISMFAFIVALGIVVDDAIVVGEIIYEKRQQGVPFFKAAVEGAREVAMPVTFSILTNVATFTPLLFIPGIMGKIFGQIPVVVITVFLVSLVEALFILPAHLSRKGWKKGKIEGWIDRKQQKFGTFFINFVNNIYSPFLQKVLKNRYITISLAFSLLLVTLAWTFSGRIGFTLMPKIESDFAAVTVVLPYGTPMNRSIEVNRQLISSARKVADEHGGKDLVEGIYSHIGQHRDGTPGAHTINMKVYLTDVERRPISTSLFTKLWRKKTGNIRNAESVLFESDRGGPGGGRSIEIEISHRSGGIVKKASRDLAKILEEIPDVKDIDDGFAPGKIQLDFEVLPQGEAMNLTAMEIASQVRSAFYGNQVFRQQRSRNELKVMVRLPEDERISEYNLENMVLRNNRGEEIPLREATSVQRGRSYTELNHRDGKRVVILSCNIVPFEKTSLVKSTITRDLFPEMKKKYPGISFSFRGRQQEMGDSMKSLFTGFAIALLVIYVLLAIPFKSYTQPLIIMISIPFGIIGAIYGHMLMGYPLSVNSMMGVVALSGVVVNDSLVLIDYTNRLRAEGHTALEAVLKGTVRRFRPIILTTMTTFGGLAPMIMETSKQAKFMIPMAISLGFGILFATVITLIIVPSLYLIIDDIVR